MNKEILELAGSAALLAAVVGIGAAMQSAPTSKPAEFNAASAEVYCKDLIKSDLRDPDSYQFIAAHVLKSNGTMGEALISFRARNGFNGYVNGVAKCKQASVSGGDWTAYML